MTAEMFVPAFAFIVCYWLGAGEGGLDLSTRLRDDDPGDGHRDALPPRRVQLPPPSVELLDAVAPSARDYEMSSRSR
jgi:hypothetical protein